MISTEYAATPIVYSRAILAVKRRDLPPAVRDPPAYAGGFYWGGIFPLRFAIPRLPPGAFIGTGCPRPIKALSVSDGICPHPIKALSVSDGIRPARAHPPRVGPISTTSTPSAASPPRRIAIIQRPVSGPHFHMPHMRPSPS